MFVAGATGIGYPLSAMQLLWINLISDIFPCLALAMESPEPGILDRPPRDPKEPIIGRSDFKRIGFESGVITLATLGAYGIGLSRYGIGPRASTLAFQSLANAQLLHAISCRSERVSIYDEEKLPPNRYLTLALAGSLGLQLLTLCSGASQSSRDFPDKPLRWRPDRDKLDTAAACERGDEGVKVRSEFGQRGHQR